MANQGDNTVTKLRARDGKALGTFATGVDPEGVAFAGLNIWITNWGDNTVSKLRAVEGKTLGTFPAGTNPIDLAFDGANMWSTDYNGSLGLQLNLSGGCKAPSEHCRDDLWICPVRIW